MDFISHNLKRMNQKFTVNSADLNFIPKKNLSELEQLNNKMMDSMRIKLQNPDGTYGDRSSFQKMVDQTLGHDLSIVSELTRDYLESKKKKLDE
ncbi:MAG: hypothetical protein AB7V56_06320 [Candidatus Nitrosocosmicus sp.]|uniref:hypothetical protein n=1 Tax=Candidatus Nitrosocosmicus agrestis TaxID=2563600 RepID=UPI00122DC6BE|nr:hypothetical protein [Candidatus Nitrosocosmicus sp. SS]KAA2283338.1 hypothetical protein F1Z66_02265 [Candidatus Nitrosocosmicus sp. SS]KAF0868412.1 hypothetical protein E5N71_09975 [Candidatus Nitrosocosmicus sp. SS]MDR4491967.1 hypothetical protein [Candidatus Nitrosocosmicus sp.]HET6590495.1 hypothetical protein [Candidatus Nitrosocosmicus sp.]